jgi:hypothetical protein
MSVQNLALLAVLFFVVAGCGIDALFRRRNERIHISTCEGNPGDSGDTIDCGGFDGGGCD